jgi:long-chain acyl-CoA synthetase
MEKMTLYQAVKKTALTYPDRIAYDFLDRKVTYRDFLDAIDRMATGLKNEGVGHQDIVTIYLPNIPKALILYYALNKLGAISNFIHPQLAIAEHVDLLKKMRPKMIFLLDTMPSKVDELRKEGISSYFRLVSISDDLPLKSAIFYRVKELIAYRRIGGELSDKNLMKTLNNFDAFDNPDAIATILLTGGTTGQSKGVCLSSHNMNASAFQTAHHHKNKHADDKMLAILPVFHGYGLVNCIHTTLLEGSTVILLPKFNEKQFKKILINKKPNYILGVPKLFHKMITLFLNDDLSFDFLKGLYCGGTKLSDKTLDHVNAFLKSVNSTTLLREGYGLTECVGACTLMPENTYKSGSIGIPYDGVKLHILEPATHKQVALGEIGEIAIQSDTVMKGYYGEPSPNLIITESGQWLLSGDLGYLDKDGYLFYIDRIKRMVKILGYDVYPSRVESVILQVNGILNCCVVRSSDSDDSILKAYIVSDPSYDTTIIEKSILKECTKNLSRWSIPREIAFVDEIPVTLLKKNHYRTLSD